MNGNRETQPKEYKAHLKTKQKTPHFFQNEIYLFTLDSQSPQYYWSSSHSLVRGHRLCHLLELWVEVSVVFLQQLSLDP